MIAPALLARFFEDAALAPPSQEPAAEAVGAFRQLSAGARAKLLGPLVVGDRRLAELGRACTDGEPIDVRVVNTGGAGGLLGLSARAVRGVRVVAVDSALRDLDDLTGNVARVVAAAEQLDPDIRVHVELPYAPGWEDAVVEVEAAGLLGKLRAGDDPSGPPEAGRLARQLSVLIEADLPFTIGGLAGLRSTAGRAGVLDVLVATYALIEGATEAEATEVIGASMIAVDAVAGWDEAAAARVRRRCLSASIPDLRGALAELSATGLVGAP